MKSVVVEGSTVAKAIEAGWLKADKPEEFFIRVLQEHSSGFLGFGAQKAKIVLFFKNNNKSDSLFPTVLKQKEYTNFFSNKNLKNPTELNVVDTQLNKNVITAGGQKKKAQASHSDKQVEQGKQNQQKNHSTKVHSQAHNKPALDSHAKQVTLQKVATQNHVQASQVKQSHKYHAEKHAEHKAGMQIQQQAQHKKAAMGIDGKEDVVGNIAKVLKKVQSQKIVANVSRQALKTPSQGVGSHDVRVDKTGENKSSGIQAEKAVVYKHTEKAKVVTPKFESYAEFMDAQADKAAAKAQSIIEQVSTVAQNSDLALDSAPDFAIHSKTSSFVDVSSDKLADKEKVIVDSVDSIVAKIESLHGQVVANKPVAVAHHDAVTVEKPVVAKRPFIKMKRRPLTTDNPGVSGITRSSDKKQSENNLSDKNDNE